MLEVLAPAKINLALDVLHKRSDGYHEIEMVMQTVDLWDRLYIELTSSGIVELDCQHHQVPLGAENLAWQAAELMLRQSGCGSGVKISLNKRIPVAAGLAGGSANAAAVIRGLNQLLELGLSHDEMVELGLQLGADVPFCIKGGTALARGIGQVLQDLTPPPPLWVALLTPEFSVSTAEIYNSFCPDQVETRPDIPGLVAALEKGETEKMVNSMANVLESVTFRKLPMLAAIKEKAVNAGALTALMSGSGPTVFALAADYQRAVAISNSLSPLVECSHVVKFRGECQ